MNLFREKTARAGIIYKDEIVIFNTSQQKKEVQIRKKNLKMTIGGIKFIDCEEEKYSLSAWLKLKWERFYIEPASKVIIPYEIIIPEKVAPATYHCLLIISAKTPVKGKESIGIAIQHAIQILCHIEGEKKDAEIFNVEMGDDDILNVDIRNTGSYWTKLILSNDLLGKQEIKIYNDQERRIEFDCSKLEDKFYKDIRIIFDDGDTFLKAQKISFRKGEEPKKIPLSKIRSERLERRRGRKPYSLYASINYGNCRQGLSLTGTLRIWDFSLSAGSMHSEYHYGDMVSDFESQRLSLNFRKEWFSIGMGNSWYSGKWMSIIRTGINFRKLQANINYSIKYKILSANVSHRIKIFKRNFNLRISGFMSENREDWNVSLMIPIL